MMLSKVIKLSLIWWIVNANALFAQPTIQLPKIGDICPNLVFSDVHYFRKSKVSIKDFRGKWLIVQAWNKNCSSCLSMMPAEDSLQKVYHKKVQYLLVGFTGTNQAMPVWGSDEGRIKKLYPKTREKFKLTSLPVAYDSVLFKRFDITAGATIIIDPNGIIRGITTELKAKDLEAFLAGKTPELEHAITLTEYYRSLSKERLAEIKRVDSLTKYDTAWRQMMKRIQTENERKEDERE